jgi:hypothetical protein
MPKLEAMAQLSRPFQLAVLASAVLVLGLFFVLHRPGGSTSGSSSAASSSAASSPSSPAAGSSVHHGSASGLEGLTRAVQRAQGAVAATQHNAQEVQRRAEQAPGGASSTAGRAHGAAASTKSTKVTTGTHAGRTSPSPAGQAARHAQHAAVSGPATTGATAASILHRLTAAEHLNAVLELLNPQLRAQVTAAEGLFVGRIRTYLQSASQATVAGELHHGQTVLLLFLNPSSYDDDATAIETVVAAHDLGHGVAVHFALAGQVNSFGSVTRDIQVYQTPTLMVINPEAQVTTLTGLSDSFAIKQAVAEAKE